MTSHIRRELLATLEDRAHRAWEGSGTVGLLLAGAGMGKTHLATEFLERLPADTALLRGSAPPTGSAPLFPVSEALTGANRLTDEITDLVEEYAGAVPMLREALAPFLRVHRKLRHGRALSQDVAPSETFAFSKLLSVFRRLSERRHVVLFMDDVQWLDPSSVAFLGYLARETPTLKTFVLLSARTNGAESSTLRSISETLDRLPPAASLMVRIPPLTPAETGEVAGELLGGPVRLSDEQLQWLQVTSHGNPLYLAEVLTLLRTGGTVVAKEYGWAFAAEPGCLVVPPSFAKVMHERLTAATAGTAIAESAVQYGAVLGRRFDARLLARLLRTSTAQVISSLSVVGLETGYILREPAGTVFTFNHDLTREAVLQYLGSSAVALHLDVAKTLRSLPKSRPREIAWHYRGAGDHEHAAKYYALAYRWSADRSAYLDAAGCAEECDRSLAAAGFALDSPERLEAAEDVADALLGAERYAEVVAALQDRVESGVQRKRARLARLLGRAQARLSEEEAHRSAERWLRTALRFSEQEGDRVQAAETWTDLVYVYDALGEYERSQMAFRTALRLAQNAGLAPLVMRLLRMTCIFFQPELVRDYVRDALKMAVEQHLRHEQGLCLNNLGTAYFHLREFGAAEEQFIRSRRVLERLGGYRVDYPTNNLGLLQLLNGRPDEGRHLLNDALERCHDADARLFICSNVALADALEKRLDQAARQWRELLPLADATGDLFYRDCIRHNLAVALSLLGDGRGATLVARGCPPHHAATDDLLVRGKRAQLLLQAMACGAEDSDRLQLERDARVLADTTKPQAWLYREPWYYCDIEFWED
jgi:tetratricopeptide (TPR) repeat protein